ncbi:hypothetical protein [Pseudomonas sp. S1_E04]
MDPLSIIGMAPTALNMADKGMDLLGKGMDILDKGMDMAQQAMGQINPQGQEQQEPSQISF